MEIGDLVKVKNDADLNRSHLVGMVSHDDWGMVTDISRYEGADGTIHVEFSNPEMTMADVWVLHEDMLEVVYRIEVTKDINDVIKKGDTGTVISTHPEEGNCSVLARFASDKEGMVRWLNLKDIKPSPTSPVSKEPTKESASPDMLLRNNKGKPNWHLVDFESFESMVRVLEFGASKYDADNWKKPANRKELLDSTFRHLKPLMDTATNGITSDEFDEETGLPHMAHVMCNAMFYMYHLRNGDWTEERNNPYPEKEELKHLGSQNLNKNKDDYLN